METKDVESRTLLFSSSKTDGSFNLGRRQFDLSEKRVAFLSSVGVNVVKSVRETSRWCVRWGDCETGSERRQRKETGWMANCHQYWSTVLQTHEGRQCSIIHCHEKMGRVLIRVLCDISKSTNFFLAFRHFYMLFRLYTSAQVIKELRVSFPYQRLYLCHRLSLRSCVYCLTGCKDKFTIS